jgi:hypothetical protein
LHNLSIDDSPVAAAIGSKLLVLWRTLLID